MDYYDADSSSDSAKWAITSDNTPDYNSDYYFVGFTDDSGSSESSFDPTTGRSDRSGNQGTNRMKRSTSSFSHQSSIDDLSNFVSLGKTIQESVIQFIQTEKPEHRFFETDAVLVEGNYTFKLSIDTDGIDWNSDGLFIDYIALLPSQYYEPNILKKKITEPCSYSEKVGGKCMMYDHVGLEEYHTIEEYSLHKLPLLNFDIEPALLFNTKPGQIQPFERMLTIDAAADPSTAINTLYAQTTPPGAGEYVVVIDYVNPIDQYQQMKVNVNLQRSGIARVETVIFNIYSCDYLFTCRQVGLDRSGAIKKVQLEYLQTYFTFLDDQPLNRLKVYIDKVYLIPAEDFDVEMVEPKAKCVTDIGPRFEGCYPSIYPSRPAQGMELSHSNWTSTFKTETFVVTGAELSSGKSTFVFGNIHPANYVFVIQYYQKKSFGI